MKQAGRTISPKRNKSKMMRPLFFCLAFVLTSALSGLFSSGTSSYKIDKFAYDVSLGSPERSKTAHNATYVKIEDKKARTTLYNDLLTQFYYSDDSGSVRQVMTNDTRCSVIGENDLSVSLYSQNTFSITSELAADGGYRIDLGIFHSYFSDNELGARYYIGRHHGCQTFGYISDVFADKLLEKYGLEKNIQSYIELIKNPNYGVLNISIDGTTNLTCSINNIIYTDKRQAPRCCEFNPNFCLIELIHFAKDLLQPSFEIDLKPSPYYVKSVLNKTEKMGYSVNDFTYTFNSFERESQTYTIRSDLNHKYVNLRNSKTALLFSALWLISLLSVPFVTYFLSKDISSTFGIIFSLSFIIGIIVLISLISNFAFLFFGFSLTPLLFLLSFVLTKGGVFNALYHQRFFGQGHMGRKTFYKI